MTTFQIFSYTSGLSALIPAIVGLIYFRNLKSYARWVLGLVIFSLIIDCISFYVRTEEISSLPYVHQFFLWQVPIIFMVFFHSGMRKKYLTIVSAVITVVAFLLMVYFLWGRWDNERMVIQIPWISTIGSILISILYLFGRVSYSDIEEELINHPLLILELIMIYQCSIISTFAVYDSLLKDIYKLKLVVYVIFNLILGYIFYRHSKMV